MIKENTEIEEILPSKIGFRGFGTILELFEETQVPVQQIKGEIKTESILNLIKNTSENISEQDESYISYLSA